MKISRTAFFAALLIPGVCQGELLEEHWIFSIANESHLSDTGLGSEAMTKQDRQIYKLIRNSKYSWGDYDTAIHFDDPFKMGSSNSFLDQEGVGAYTGVRFFSTLNKNLYNSKLNFWLYNAFISSYYIVENNNYIGFSWDTELFGFKVRPALGYNYTISVKSPINGKDKFGVHVDDGTNGISSGIFMLTASRNIPISQDYQIGVGLLYEAKFARDSMYNAVSNNPNDTGYGHHLRLGFTFPIYDNFSASATYISKYNVTGYGSDGDGNIFEAAISYRF
ncbi:hypothetical protein [Shewanella sp. GXUN23E]|uniref:hypothetical protein n=1 Tax=Shewanella sp. GXUN23E TaxID=3422498 RepID=UPI003D7E39AF